MIRSETSSPTISMPPQLAASMYYYNIATMLSYQSVEECM